MSYKGREGVGLVYLWPLSTKNLLLAIDTRGLAKVEGKKDQQVFLIKWGKFF